MEVNLIAVLFNRFDVKDAVKTILSHDCDFSENEEYFREDTLELGFENEADRVGKEFADKYKEVTSKLIGEVLEYSTGDTQFIVGNGTYTDTYDYHVDVINDTQVYVSVAYGSN